MDRRGRNDSNRLRGVLKAPDEGGDEKGGKMRERERRVR